MRLSLVPFIIFVLVASPAWAGWEQINSCVCVDRPGISMPVMGIYIFDSAHSNDISKWLLLKGLHYAQVPEGQTKETFCQSLIEDFELAGVCNQKVWRSSDK